MSQDDLRSELIRGELCEMPPPSGEHSEIAGRLVSLLRAVAANEQRGRVFTDGGVIVDRDPDTVRAPDVSLFLTERLSPTERVTGYFEVAPSLVVEVKSPSDRVNQLHDKALMWLNAGVDMVWVVLPDTRSVDIYRSDTETVTVAEPDTLDGGDVLPGFRCDLADIFGPRPEPTQQATEERLADGR